MSDELNQSELRDGDFTPVLDFVESLANESHNHFKVLAELIDNAFDAGATNVEIRFQRDAFEVSDNGSGCADLEVMLKPGARKSQSTTRLGRYGIGAKNAMFWLGGSHHEVRIESTNKKDTSTLRVNWGDMVKNNSWKLSGCIKVRPATVGDRGTFIRVSPIAAGRRLPAGKHLDRLIADIGHAYAPGLIAQQRTIRITSKEASRLVIAWELPPFTDSIDVSIVMDDGRRARVIAGIVAPGVPNEHPGLSYWHEFRTILADSSSGCGDRSIAGFCGHVQLIDGWRFTKNKENFSERGDELFAKVFAACESLLIRAESASNTIEVDTQRKNAERLLNQYTGRGGDGSAVEPDTKAKRGKGDTVGAKVPTGRGSKHSRAAVEQDGRTFPTGRRSPNAPLRIEYVNSPESEERAAWVVNASDCRVFLNQSHPFIASLTGQPNMIALAALAHWTAAAPDKGTQLGFGAAEFFVNFGRRTLDVLADPAPALRLLPKAAAQ